MKLNTISYEDIVLEEEAKRLNDNDCKILNRVIDLCKEHLSKEEWIALYDTLDGGCGPMLYDRIKAIYKAIPDNLHHNQHLTEHQHGMDYENESDYDDG